MLIFALRRLGIGLMMLFTVTFLAFLFLSLGGGNAASAILGTNASQQDIDTLTEQLGLNDPFHERYFSWLVNALQLNLGEAWSSPEMVSDAIASRLSTTITLVILTTIIVAIVSTLLGTLAAIRGGWVDKVVQIGGLVGFAVPGFLVAFLLVTVLAVQLPIFAAIGYVDPGTDFVEWLRSATLPVMALAMNGAAAVTQQVRGAVKDALQADYVRTLRARGLGRNSVIYRHVLRNAGGPALSVLGVQFVGMLGGAVIIETIFAIPGIGQYIVNSTQMTDIPSVMGLVTVTAVLVIAVNLIIDLLSAALNPKVRLS